MIRTINNLYEYRRRCYKEITDIIKQNPIRFEDITIGDLLTFYKPLYNISKYKQLYEPRKKIKDNLYKQDEIRTWILKDNDIFTIYDKMEIQSCYDKYPSYLVRINKPPKYDPNALQIDLWQSWFNIKYFEIMQSSLKF